MNCRVHPAFYHDLANQELWLLEHAGAEVADRWHDLAEHPHIGRQRADLRMEGVRTWRIHGFERWLIFYRVSDGVIVLFRVVPGAMQLERMPLD